MNAVSSDSESELVSGERQRMMVAHLAARTFFRMELLKQNVGWPPEQLQDRGASAVLSTESTWKIGYAPDSYTRLTDHLLQKGFDFRTLIRAGLAEWTEEGTAVDVFRDQLMILARDERLDPVGFVGIGQGAKPAFEASPTTLIHRPSNALVGVEEQLEILTEGALVVVVDDPLDAMAIENLGRKAGERWAGIPLCGSQMSSAQAKILYRYTVTDTVIVALDGDQEWRSRALASHPDLSYFYKRVRAVEIPDGHTPSSLLQTEDGAQRLYDAMVSTRPLEDYKPRRQHLPELDDPSPSPVGPAL
ncbi:DNA primase-like protein [Kribbella sp. VKM Ac-2571]|nr:DNA primase-like protein [Kribbella sp. VKM Ac-2571]